MAFRPEEVSAIIQQQIEKYDSKLEMESRGTVLQVGDGIARVWGLRGRHGRRAAEVSRRRHRHGAEPRGGQRRRRALFGRHDRHQGRRHGQAHRPRRRGARRRRPCSAAWSTPSASRIDGKGPIATDKIRVLEGARARRHRAPAGEGAAADRAQGHRLDDPDRPRPARADHRRPPDRQDGHRHRHDHQPEGHRRELHLRGHRPEGVDRRPGGGHARGARRDGVHDSSWRPRATEPAPLQYIAPYAGCAMGEDFLYKGKHALVRLRRSFQAGRGLPPDVAAAAPPAGTRGLPGRRLLPAHPPARARLPS